MFGNVSGMFEDMFGSGWGVWETCLGVDMLGRFEGRVWEVVGLAGCFGDVCWTFGGGFRDDVGTLLDCCWDVARGQTIHRQHSIENL